MSVKSIGIIVKSSQNNENSELMLTFLKNYFTKLDYKVTHTYISDEIEDILETCNKNCDILIVTGKISSISQDLCKVFNENLVLSDHLASVYNLKQDSSPNKFYLPENSQIFQIQTYANGIDPVFVKFRHIYILPNDLISTKIITEKLLSKMVDNYDVIQESFSKRYVVKCDQNGRANNIKEKMKEICAGVIIHYCLVKSMSCELNIIYHCNNLNQLFLADGATKKMLPSDVILAEYLCDGFWANFDEIQDEKYVQQALTVIKKCYTDFEPEEVFLSFNGGKDCTVLLYLTVYVLRTLHPNYKDKLLCMYIQSEHPFTEVEDFIENCRDFYNLNVVMIRNTVKHGLREILESYPNLKACLIGVRRTDPYSHDLEHFQMTDCDWPQVMRVSPILDWKYSEIWSFLLKLNIPYCGLYDLGYTSLGSKTNTIPNPALKIPDELDATISHLPAYKLHDDSKERYGRLKI